MRTQGPSQSAADQTPSADVETQAAAEGVSDFQRSPASPASTGAPGFRPGELAIALSHFGLGVVGSIKNFKRGTGSTSKVLVRAQAGDFILKRRAERKGLALRLLFAHKAQHAVAQEGYPTPPARLSVNGESVVVAGGCVYELYPIVPGVGYPRTASATQSAGRALAKVHALFHQIEGFPPGYTHGPHNNRVVIERLAAVGGESSDAQPVAHVLDALYHQAAEQAGQVVDLTSNRQLVHGDWHPGNLLFDEQGHVTAVLDFDNVRPDHVLIELASGALQFSLVRDPAGVANYPPQTDLERLRAFAQGYQHDSSLGHEAMQAVRWLMVEALIAEAALGAASLLKADPANAISVLHMAQRKAQWLVEHEAEVNAALAVV